MRTIDKNKNKNFTSSSCNKCESIRWHDRIHHCSRCNRCVNYMNHHCMFTDNCVGSNNYRYFFHFGGWAFMTLCSVLLCYLYHIYTYNRATKTGLQNVLYAFAIMNPHSLFNMLLNR